MESTSESLKTVNDDLKQLTGKTVELTREKARLTNHRDVFLTELRRIESELKTVTDELDKVTADRKKAAWNRKKLRFLLAWQMICRCVHHFFTMITYLFFGFLHVTYVLLWLGASMVQTLLESQSFMTYNNHIRAIEAGKPSSSRSSRRSTDAPFWS